MGINTGKDFRIGSVKDRVQKPTNNGDGFQKIDTNTGKVIDTKEGDKFKGVAMDVDERRK